MKKLLLLCLVSLCTISLSAQFPGMGGFGKKKKKIKGKIEGSLIDSTTRQAIPYATIALTKAGSEKIVNGILSEEDGSFKFSDVLTGKYDMLISFLGYEDKIIKDVELTLKDPDYKIDQILLSPSAVLLDAVEVVEERALFENKVDKIVYNAENDASVAGGDAADVLRKVPTLSVDLDGNVSLRGSQNIRILINGKPSGMFSTNVKDALKMFPADQIKKVEVITSPGAKYDGEGSGGIVNIITKKENIEGVAGSVNGSLGNRQSNGSLNLNVGKGRFGFTGNGSFFYSHPVDAENNFLRTSLAGDTLYVYEGITNTSRLGFNGSLSAFYDFNAFNAINSSFSLRGFGFDQNGDASGILGGSGFNRLSDNGNLTSGFDWNTDFTKKFEDNETRELVFAVQVSGNDQDQENIVMDRLLTSTDFFRDENIFNDGDNLEITGQIDYVHPIGNSNKLEVGIKSVNRNIVSDSRFSLFNNQSQDYDLIDPSRSNIFDYDQDIAAGYASYNFFFKKFNIVTGARYERTTITGYSDPDSDNILVVDSSYTNILPNIAISRSLKNFKTIKLSYSQRIQRPSLQFINPFRNTTDIANLVQGNPTLAPEITHQIELGYNTNILGVTIFSSFYYRKTEDIIEQITIEDNGIGINTFDNVGENNSFGLNFFSTKSVGKFTIRGGGDVYTYDATGVVDGEQLANSALSYRIFTGGEYSFTGTLKADFFGFFQAPRFTLQGQNPSFSIYGVGFRKEFKNASLGLRIIEPFVANKSFDADITGTDFRQVSNFTLPFRSIGINFRYKFGKVDFKERRSKIKNTDLKQGEEGTGGGGNSRGMQGGRN